MSRAIFAPSGQRPEVEEVSLPTMPRPSFRGLTSALMCTSVVALRRRGEDFGKAPQPSAVAHPDPFLGQSCSAAFPASKTLPAAKQGELSSSWRNDDMSDCYIRSDLVET